MDENEDNDLKYDTETQHIATTLAVAGTKTVNIDTKTNTNTNSNQNENQNLGNLAQELSVTHINP